MKRVCVITPSFNAEKYIGECVESVTASVTLDKFQVEHIIVDDGSTDGTREIVQGMNRSGLTTIFLEKNAGQSKARNVGLKATDSDYVFFLDADDVLFSNSLRYLFETGEKWAYGDFLRGDESGKYEVGKDYYGWEFKNCEQVLYSMYTGWHFFQQNSLYDRKMLLGIDGFDENLKMAEDFDLATRLLLMGILPQHISGPLYMHRNHARNLSVSHRAHPESHKSDVRKIYEKYKTKIQTAVGAKQVFAIEQWL